MTVAFVQGGAWFGWLPLVWTLGAEVPSSDTGALAIAWGVALVCCLWALKEREKREALYRTTAAEKAHARAEILLRDGLFGHAQEAVVVWDADNQQHLSFGEGAPLLDACLAGPERENVSVALDALRRNGTAFEISARHAEGVVALRGCPIGRYAAVFLQRERNTSSVKPDYRAMLEALPVPVWLRDKDLRLCWANNAFAEAVGAPTNDQAIKSNCVLDRSERDLALSARDAAAPIESQRYAVVQGVRRALSLWSQPLADGTVAGAAYAFADVADADSRMRSRADAYAHALNGLPVAVAIFDPERKLIFSNRSYARLWGLEKDWLERGPSAGEILDRLRELRRLPEQSDFSAWKRDRLGLIDAGGSSEELWHLPNGKTLRITSRPRPVGGVLYMLEDVTEHLRQESAYNALIKVQQATLNMLQEGVAVFGTDGRLRLHNAAFSDLWRLHEDDLENGPHLKGIAEICTARFGNLPIWDVISSSVTAASPKEFDGSIDVERADGRIISLSLVRLPDGAVLVTFTDVTDYMRLESVLREAPTAA